MYTPSNFYMKSAVLKLYKTFFLGDEGPTASEEGLFKISALKSSNDLKEVLDNRTGDVDYDSEG